MRNYPSTLTSSIIVPSRLVFFMWAVHSLNFFLGIYLGKFAIIPREPIGLIGIAMAPLIHVNHLHLISNTFPVLFLGTTLYYFYDRIANKVFLICYFITGALVWILGRPPSHVGASGLIYGLAFFLIFLGIFRKDIKSLLISLIIITFYWTLFYGIIPSNPVVSWESHLFGGMVGGASAYWFSKKGRIAN